MSRGLSEEESSVPSRKNIPVRGRTSTQAPRWEQGTAVVRGRRGRQCAVIRWARRRLVRGAAEMVTWALSAGKAVCVGFEMRARKPLEAFRQGTSTAGRHLERSLWGAAGQGEKQGGPCSNPGQRGGAGPAIPGAEVRRQPTQGFRVGGAGWSGQDCACRGLRPGEWEREGSRTAPSDCGLRLHCPRVGAAFALFCVDHVRLVLPVGYPSAGARSAARLA